MDLQEEYDVKTNTSMFFNTSSVPVLSEESDWITEGIFLNETTIMKNDSHMGNTPYLGLPSSFEWTYTMEWTNESVVTEPPCGLAGCERVVTTLAVVSGAIVVTAIILLMSVICSRRHIDMQSLLELPANLQGKKKVSIKYKKSREPSFYGHKSTPTLSTTFFAEDENIEGPLSSTGTFLQNIIKRDCSTLSVPEERIRGSSSVHSFFSSRITDETIPKRNESEKNDGTSDLSDLIKIPIQIAIGNTPVILSNSSAEPQIRKIVERTSKTSSSNLQVIVETEGGGKVNAAFDPGDDKNVP